MSKLSVDEIISSLEYSKQNVNCPDLKEFPAGYSSMIGRRKGCEWVHQYQGHRMDPFIIYNDILEYCLRKEFDTKLNEKNHENKDISEKVEKLEKEIDTLKQALADTLAALAAK
jgi:hypothetical protein